MYLALMVYRATPITATSFSPSEIMIGRKLRTTIPALLKTLKSGMAPSQKILEENYAKAQRQYADHYNRRHGVRELAPLDPGTQVRLQKNPGDKWGTKGTVVETHETPRSYIIDTDNGRYRRNRQHIRSSPQSPPTQPQDRDKPVDEPVDESAAVPEIHRQPSGQERKLPERFKDCLMY
ncbi:hypothetical protein CAPTEDRAFT_194439 [Capitella teleta]|uniref:Uncharacterized protein n=1 Tax=Capitella teleta TaxID=283909 RepID=R7UL10_CAPTE|nr:hypothetical protein CAPTEDRAFT_194439 [Capitella teleta]|eukprot:ELU06798.1 hypothetical protein CAPTEDRAFT_194439 [Capitella teleta]